MVMPTMWTVLLFLCYFAFFRFPTSALVAGFTFTGEQNEHPLWVSNNRQIVFGWTKLGNSSVPRHYSFTMKARGVRSWVGVGITNSTGIGESYMTASGSVAVIGRSQPLSEAKEYELRSISHIVPYVAGDLSNQNAMFQCVNQFCMMDANICAPQPKCASALLCVQQAVGSNLTQEETLTACVSPLANETSAESARALGAFLRVTGCVFTNCAAVLEATQRVTSLASASFAQVQNVSNGNEWVTTLTFETVAGMVAGRMISPEQQTFIFAFGNDNSFSNHGEQNRMAVTLNLLTGNQITDIKVKNVVYTHVVLVTMGLAILIPIAILLKFVGKGEWHAVIVSLGSLLCLAGVFYTFVAFPIEFGRTSHSVVGLIVMLLVIVELSTILLRPATDSLGLGPPANKKEISDEDVVKERELAMTQWKYIHSLLGFLILTLGVVTSYLGFEFVNSRTSERNFLFPLSTLFYISFALVVLGKLADVMVGKKKEKLVKSDSVTLNLVSNENPVYLNHRDHDLDLESNTALPKQDSDVVNDFFSIHPIYLGFRGVGFTIPGKKQTAPKRIVLDASGYCAPQTLTAVIGPSGAGKTTLLDLLTLRIPADEGVISINGRVSFHVPPRRLTTSNEQDARTFQNLSFLSGYVRQADVLHQYLTVWETLAYTATLLLREGERERTARVLKVVNQLGLGNALHTLVGGADVRGLSGGERKRVSVAIQLLKSPSLLFLDEPTSGLDSHTAAKLMSVLRELANEGRTLIATIHQPSVHLFEFFDRLILLSGGNTVFSGNRIQAEAFFKRVERPIPPRWNPADWYVTVIDVEPEDLGKSEKASAEEKERMLSVRKDMEEVDVSALSDAIRMFYFVNNRDKLEENPKIVAECTKFALVNGLDELNRRFQSRYAGKTINVHSVLQRQKVHSATKEELALMVRAFAKSDYRREIEGFIDKDLLERKTTSVEISGKTRRTDYAQSLNEQITILVRRSVLLAFRDPQVFKLQSVQNVLFGIIVGSLYSSLGNSPARLLSMSFAMAICLGLMVMVTIAWGTAAHFSDKQVYARESEDRLYSPLANFCARLCVTIPHLIFAALCLIVPCYFWVQLRPDGFFFFFLMVLVLGFVFDSLIACIVFFAKDLAMAYGLANFYLALALFMSGVLIPFPLIPVFWRWLYFITPFSYSFASVVVNEFEGTMNEYWVGTIGVWWKDQWGNFLVVLGMGVMFRLFSLVLALRVDQKLSTPPHSSKNNIT